VSGARPDRNKVAIVGHLMDRTEQDHRANVAELRRVLGALDLEVSSVWLEGEPFDRLSAAKDAGTIIALPLGRKAARTLAARTGADVLDVDVPFGLARTRRLLRDVGRALRRERAAEAFVDQELRRLLPRVEWVLRHVFFGKKAIFSGSPDLFGAMRQVLSELGMEVRHMSSPSSRTHLPADFERDGGSLPPMLFAPTLETLRKELAPVIGEGIDLAIGNSLFCDMVGAEAPVVEVGFPAHFSHALSARPLLGFEGWIHFVDRASEALQRGARATRFARRQNLFERGRIEELLGVAKRLREGESPMAVAAAIEAIARGGAAPSRGGAGEPRPERSGPLDEPSRADDLERGGLDELAAE
jgi:nitrogenase molybdenum-iron protein alpha/beta subunit